MHAVPQLKQPVKPWYREPWPWLLMSGPFAVIVAGAYTTVLAFSSTDGLVADDYYKQGLAINRTLAREDRAVALALTASVAYAVESGRVRVVLAGNAEPATLLLRLTHPTRAGMDQKVEMKRGPGGIYEGAITLPPAAGRWNAVLETPDWRLAGSWADPSQAALSLKSARS
jgi:hypothetical protein